MSRRLLAVLLGCLLVVPCAGALAAGPANVRVRVEGANATLVERVALKTDTRTVNKDGMAGHDCTGTSAAGGLEIATAGNWSGSFFNGLGYSVERILGETHAFPEPNFFELWINDRSQAVGVCQAELQEGDDLLFLVARCEVGPAPDFACQNPPVLPLGLSVPSTVARGASFNATVVEFSPTGVPSPVAGATVAGGDAAAVTNDAGVATVTLSSGGPRTLKATKAGRVRSAGEAVCATSGSDGACGTAVAEVGGASRCVTSGRDGRCGSRDFSAPAVNIRNIADGKRFARGSGPRTLRVVADPDPSGLLTVKLRLTRVERGRCSYFSGKLERFVVTGRGRCSASAGFWFAVGDRQETSYLLPAKLPRGRYVLDANVIDRAYNRDDKRRRGGNRVVFHVG
jgi:hypothetical protein